MAPSNPGGRTDGWGGGLGGPKQMREGSTRTGPRAWLSARGGGHAARGQAEAAARGDRGQAEAAATALAAISRSLGRRSPSIPQRQAEEEARPLWGVRGGNVAFSGGHPWVCCSRRGDLVLTSRTRQSLCPL